MSPTWQGEADLALPRPGPGGWARAAARGLGCVVVLAGGLGLLALARLAEGVVRGPRRPWSPWVTVWTCRACLQVMGLAVRRGGAARAGAGAVVANHSSWLDVLVLNADGPVVFVSKAEVAGWPGIGLLARATGTLFVRREARAEAAAQAAEVAARLRAGERLLLFPEGTSTDGRRVLPFKPALLAGLLHRGLPPGLAVQPVTLAYRAPAGEDPRFYGWWGGATLGPSALAVLAAARPGRVDLVRHAAIPVGPGSDRKAVAREAEAAVRAGLLALGISPPSPRP